MKKQLHILFTASAIILNISLLFCSQATAKDQLNEILFMTASNMNKQLPMMGSRQMEASRVMAINHDLQFYYRFVDRVKSQINLNQEKSNLYATVKRGVCSTPETAEFLRLGVRDRFLYYDKNSTYLFDFYIDKNDCLATGYTK